MADPHPNRVKPAVVSRSRSANLRRFAVDWPALARDLYAACHTRGLTVTAASAEMGLDKGNLAALRSGRPLSADALACLLAWLYPDAIPPWIKETR
ncbi:hypothetical protein SUDANB95_05496 [Actinosynnema sp. ALI-1.44]